MLRQLLTPAAVEQVRFRYPKSWLADPLCDTTSALLQHGIDQQLWNDAEGYIAALGSGDERLASLVAKACPDAFSARRSEDAKPTDFMNTLWIYARELVAAQCMNFVEEAQNDIEQWLAYDRWVKHLPDDDVIISFNYDEVVETAFWRHEKVLVTPNPRFGEDFPIDTDGQLLLKLHGSVTFRDTIHKGERDSIATLHHNPPFIAVPGSNKADEAVTTFEALWECASESLSKADHVTIIGYSCPKTDEMAKAMLLDTLKRNSRRPPIDVVLGTESRDARRLLTLLQSVDLDARDTEMWAEDYLSASGVGTGWEPLDRIDEWSLANKHRL
jgi:hypothetical protein